MGSRVPMRLAEGTKGQTMSTKINLLYDKKGRERRGISEVKFLAAVLALGIVGAAGGLLYFLVTRPMVVA